MAQQQSAVGPLEEVVLEGGAWTNTAHMKALYSLKKRKFIKPARIQKSGTRFLVYYRLLPGRYLLFEYTYWNKRFPPRQIAIFPYTVSPPGGEGGGCPSLPQGVFISFKNAEFLARFPPQILDFFEARPGYHGCPAWLALAEKAYSEEEHARLIELVATGAHLIEGEENE